MRTHRFEATSLVFGLIFAAIGLTVLTSATDLWQWNWSWFWPVALLLAGLLVLWSARSGKSEHSEPSD